MAKNSLLSRLRSAFRTGENFSTELSSGRSLSLPDAADICAFLTEQVDIVPLLKTEPWGEYHVPLYHLVMPFQDAEDEVHDYLGEHGLPQLARLCDLGLAEAEAPGHPFTMLAKMFALYGYDPGIARVAAIARRYPDEYMLSVSFQIYGDERHPDGPVLIEMLRNPLPGGFALVLTLDLANALCRQQRLERHPFDTAAGHKLLEDWLASSDACDFSYAVSTAASLPFITADGVRNHLAALAMDHLDAKVQMEAAWASAYRGSEAGVKYLARMATDARFSVAAQRYLEELGQEDTIPAQAKDPDFQAMAEMSDWLAHPQEFGEPPTEIELLDAREMHWPPTNDTRTLWLFRYRYAGHNEDGTDDVGIGMVGSVTFALFGEATGDLCPEDVYGLHCCWELECNGDQRAPRERSAAAGRKLLGI